MNYLNNLDSMMNVIPISNFDDLVLNIQTNPEDYCFYNILRCSDRDVFIEELKKHSTVIEYILVRKGIMLKDFVNIMRNIKTKLKFRYIFHRYAYLGEPQGSRVISRIHTNQHSIAFVFGACYEQETFDLICYNFMSVLPASYPKPTKIIAVHVLIHANKMLILDVVNPISWTNFDFYIKNELYC